MIRTAALALLLACNGQDEVDQTPQTDDPPTDDLPDPTDTSEPTSPSGSVLVLLGDTLPVLYEVRVMVADAAGAWVSSVAAESSFVVLDDVPDQAYVTVATWAPGSSVNIDTVGGVVDGDTLHFFGSEAPGYYDGRFGRMTLSLPTAPPVAAPHLSVGTACSGVVGLVTPFLDTQPLGLECFGTVPTEVTGWAEARKSSNAAPAAVAFDIEPLAGSLPNLSATLVLDNWVTDYGRQEVAYTHSGPDSAITLAAQAGRGPHTTSSRASSQPVSDADEVTVEVPADDAFHDRVAIWLSHDEGDAAGGHWIAAHVAITDVPARGEQARADVSSSQLPPMPGFVLDYATRSGDLALPDGWACDGRAPTVAQIELYGIANGYGHTWLATVPYDAAFALPELDQEVRDAFFTDLGNATLAVEVVSTSIAWDELRTSGLRQRGPDDYVRGIDGLGTGCIAGSYVRGTP